MKTQIQIFEAAGLVVSTVHKQDADGTEVCEMIGCNPPLELQLDDDVPARSVPSEHSYEWQKLYPVKRRA